MSWLLAVAPAADGWTRVVGPIANAAAALMTPGPTARSDGSDLPDRLGDISDGLVFAGHATPSSLQSPDGSDALNASTAYLTSGMWVYALACESTRELGVHCRAEGAVAYIGYRFLIGLEVPPAGSHAQFLVDLVRDVIQSLMAGASSRSALKAAAQLAVDRFSDLLAETGPTSELMATYEWLVQLYNFDVVSTP